MQPWGRDLLEERGLGGGGATECRRGNVRAARADAGLAACQAEQVLYLLGEDPFALHPRAEPRIIEPSSPDRPDAIEHLVFSRWPVLGEPCFEDRGDRVRQPEQDIACVLRPSLCPSPVYLW